jgi:hypothetical protein
MDRVDNSDNKERLAFKVKNHRMDNEVCWTEEKGNRVRKRGNHQQIGGNGSAPVTRTLAAGANKGLPVPRLPKSMNRYFLDSLISRLANSTGRATSQSHFHL